ncbi:MAG: hypothetical protein IJA17_06365 [Oscillospiraceae bacterium]|nr:hypothetical protein [Oscillospiraceae bacterium]MBQ4643143.1 hypothetical protein [Oscillospiraceae bacterium]
MHRNRRNSEPQSPAAAMLVGIFVVCFGIFWTIMAGSMFPPMAIFGILFTAIGAVNAYNTYKNLKSNGEKPHEHQDFSEPEDFEHPRAQKVELRCPYCGAPIHQSDSECEYCGSRL